MSAETTPPLASQDYDPWQLASPLQLLALLQRLGISSRVIAHWCGVKPSHVSMWTHGKRSIPLRYAPILHFRAQKALAEAAELNKKEIAAQPTEALQRATQAEFATIWTKWKLLVLHDAGTLHKGLWQQYEALGRILMQTHFTPTDRETVALMQEAILAKVDALVALTPDAPTAEDALLQRLTQAHADVETTNPPTPES